MVEDFTNVLPLLKQEAQMPILSKNWSQSPIWNAAIENSKELDRLAELKVNGFEWSDLDKALHPVLRQNITCLDQICNTWLNTGHYSDIPDRIRLIYAFICAHKAKLEYLCGNYQESLRACDEGLLKGNDLEDGSLSRFASMLCSKFLPSPPKIFETDKILHKATLPDISPGITVFERPSLELFCKHFFLRQRPLVITGMVNEWPAFQKWSFAYLNSICGHRLVPVELGNKYTDDDWRQQMMSFHNYLTNFVFPPPNTTKNEMPHEEKSESSLSLRGYLAQHRLLDQVPELLDDLSLPDYCAFGQNEFLNEKGDNSNSNEPEEETMNVFIGPSGTVSPLHTDPRHNLFCQIRGRKFVRLISPKKSDDLYLFDDLMRKNTSQIDVENVDFEKFPRFANVRCQDFIIEAGQCLYIPRGWFHHVRALEPSVSVAIWFGRSQKN